MAPCARLSAYLPAELPCLLPLFLWRYLASRPWRSMPPSALRRSDIRQIEHNLRTLRGRQQIHQRQRSNWNAHPDMITKSISRRRRAVHTQIQRKAVNQAHSRRKPRRLRSKKWLSARERWPPPLMLLRRVVVQTIRRTMAAKVHTLPGFLMLGGAVSRGANTKAKRYMSVQMAPLYLHRRAYLVPNPWII